MSFKIGINSFGCNHGRSGIGSYILSLVKNMPNIENEIQIFGHELDRYTYHSDAHISFEGVSIKDTKVAENFWHLKNLNKFIKKQKYGAVLYPTGIDLLPPVFSVSSILVIQRLLSPYLNPIKKIFVRKILNNSTGIISPTNFIQKDLINLGVPKSKIKVIRNGIDTSLFKVQEHSDEEAVVVQPFAIRKPYIIYASRLSHSGKKHSELIKAFSIFKRKYGSNHRLVIAGADGESSEEIHKAVLDSGFSSDILLTGYFPHENLPQLYASADVCIFPSAIEGVGLSVIEAMACGIPVACANAGALPEVAGDAVMYFDPENIDEIASSIAQLTDCVENFILRSQMIDQGLEWVKKYNWKVTAERTIEYISSVTK